MISSARNNFDYYCLVLLHKSHFISCNGSLSEAPRWSTKPNTFSASLSLAPCRSVISHCPISGPHATATARTHSPRLGASWPAWSGSRLLCWTRARQQQVNSRTNMHTVAVGRSLGRTDADRRARRGLHTEQKYGSRCSHGGGDGRGRRWQCGRGVLGGLTFFAPVRLNILPLNPSPSPALLTVKASFLT